MKNLGANILGMALGVAGFLVWLLPTIVFTTTIFSNTLAEVTNGFNLISFAEGVDGMVIAYSIALIALFVVAGLLALLSLVRVFIDNGKKPKYAGVQNLLGGLLALLSIVVLVFVIIIVTNQVAVDVNVGFQIYEANFSIGIASILACGISVLGALIMMSLNKK